MTLKRKTIDNFKGIGNGKLEGEFYYSENLKPGQFGLEASNYLQEMTSTSSPDRFNWFADFLNPASGIEHHDDENPRA